MTRLLLRALNAPALVLLALLGIAVQTSLFAFWPLTYLQPDIVLLLVIWFALRRALSFEGGVVTLLVSHDRGGSQRRALRASFMITYMLIYLGVRVAARLLVIPDLSSVILVTLIVSAIAKISHRPADAAPGLGRLRPLEAMPCSFSSPRRSCNGMIGQMALSSGSISSTGPPSASSAIGAVPRRRSRQEGQQT